MKRVKELQKRLAEIQRLEADKTGLPEHKVRILRKIQYVNELKELGQDVSCYYEEESPQTPSVPSAPQVARVAEDDEADSWQVVGRGKKGGTCKPREPLFLKKSLTQTIKTRPDGSCLFQALAHWFNVSPADVRRRVVKWLSLNFSCSVGDLQISVWVEAEQGIRFSAYLERLKLPEAWGGQPEIYAASQIYRTSVLVWCQDEMSDDRWSLKHEFLFPPPPGKSAQAAHILYVGGQHYDILTLKDEVARNVDQKL